MAAYLIPKCEKYPTLYSLLTYAQAKTENELLGGMGAGTRSEMITATRKIAEGPSSEKRNFDVDDVMSKLSQTTLAMKLRPYELGYKKNEDGSVDVIFPNCVFTEGCELSPDEGLLKRPNGKQKCGLTEFMCQYFKLSTGYEWDYDVLESFQPHCITRCFTF